MLKTESLLNNVKQRNSLIDKDINTEIKTLQRKLVALSFASGNNSSEYLWVLGEIKNLRKEIFNGESNN